MDAKELGKIRERRAILYLKKLGWNVEHANYAIDKFHSIDLIAKKDNKKIFCQVKGSAFFKKPFPENAIKFAQKNNVDLYYIIVSKRIYFRKYKNRL